MPTDADGSRRHALVLCLTVAVAGFVLVGCGSDGSAATKGSGAQGAALYQQSCGSCHGADLRGTDKGPSHLSQVYESGHHPDSSFRSAIANGTTAHHWDFGDMKPVSGLSGDEIDAIIAYIRGQQDKQGFEPYPPSG